MKNSNGAFTQKDTQSQKEKELLTQDDFDDNSLKICIDRIEYTKVEKFRLLDNNNIFLAIKNLRSMMIGSSFLEFRLFENSILIYSEEVMKEESYKLHDIIYVDHLDCYFLLINFKIYRKDIDEKPPYLWMDVRSGGKAGYCFRYSKMNRRFLITKDSCNMSFLDKTCTRVEIEVKRTQEDYLRDFKIFGKNEKKVVAISNDGEVLCYVFNFALKKLAQSSQFNLELIKEREERGLCVSVCKKNKMMLVATCDRYTLSRLAALKFEGNSLKLSMKAMIDLYEQNTPRIYPLECFGYYGERHVLWVGLSSKYGEALLFDFDTEAEVLREWEEKRCSHEEHYPYQLIPVDDHFYYIGRKARMMKISLKFSP